MSKQITREEFLRIYFNDIIGEQEAQDGSTFKVTDWPVQEIALETVNDLLPTVVRVLQGGRAKEIA